MIPATHAKRMHVAHESGVKINPEVMKARIKNWVQPEPRVSKGYLNLYSRLVSSAAKGAIIS